MTRRLFPRSVGARLHETLDLAPEAVLAAIGLTANRLYAISNSDRRIKLGLEEAVRLDAALIALGHLARFESLFSDVRAATCAQLGGAPPYKAADLRDRLAAAAVASLGGFAEEIRAVSDPSGAGGSKIMQALLIQAERLEAIPTQLRRDIAARAGVAA